jgi:acyl-coenzyme A synthetase/AMP-(fatty) acid ligase
VRDAAIDAIVSSGQPIFEGLDVPLAVTCQSPPVPCGLAILHERETEWLMLTSGTTGDPKIAVHTLKGLTGAIKPSNDNPVWGTFYDIRRYGGLQIFLRAMLDKGSLVLSQPGEPVADHLVRLGAAGVTHISGTPTHWRRALLSSAVTAIDPRYIRLSGEIADQAVLDALKNNFPNASIGHAYASTEAGVGFEVTDGREGFPESYLRGGLRGVEMKIEQGSLRVRSGRMASHYAGRPDLALLNVDGYIDTGDLVEVRNGRCYFTGRRDGVINVGGLKVHPEEIETVINRHKFVRQSLVRPRRSPIIGSIVVADVVFAPDLPLSDQDRIKAEIMGLCRDSLAAHKIPVMINSVSAIDTTAGGKLPRHHA